MKRTIRKQKYVATVLLIVLSFIAVFWTAEAQTAGTTAKPAQQEEVLNNSTVIDLKGLGLGEGVIVEKIKSSACDFDVSLNGLKQLKAAGVSDGIITAMLSAKSGTRKNGGAVEEGDPNDPKSPHEAGIWLYEESGGKARMVQLEPSVYSQSKSGVGLFMQFGQTIKSKAVIAGAHASIVSTSRRPTFYFYFANTPLGLGGARHGAATSANEYILAQFEVTEKDNQRHLVTGSLNAYSGDASGAEGKSIRSFGFEKLSPGIYKVTPKEDLASGEYGFYYGASTGGGSVFDFGVKGSPETEPKPLIVENKKTQSNPNKLKSFFQKKN